MKTFREDLQILTTTCIPFTSIRTCKCCLHAYYHKGSSGLIHLYARSFPSCLLKDIAPALLPSPRSIFHSVVDHSYQHRTNKLFFSHLKKEKSTTSSANYHLFPLRSFAARFLKRIVYILSSFSVPFSESMNEYVFEIRMRDPLLLRFIVTKTKKRQFIYEVSISSGIYGGGDRCWG